MKQTNTNKNKWLLPSLRKQAIIKKIKQTLGGLCFAIAILPNGLFIPMMSLSLMLSGLRIEDIQDYKRIVKCKLRGWL